MKLTLVETMRQNKTCTPKQLKPTPTEAIGSVKYAFQVENTLLSVKIKRNKNVYILSSMHHDVGHLYYI